MNKLDEIINHLASQEPQLDQAELFCNDLLDRLPEQPRPAVRPYWHIALRSISSAAAILLLVLYLLPQQPSVLPEAVDYTAALATVQPSWRTALSDNCTPQQVLEEYTHAKRNNSSIVELKKRLTQ
jgi:hypothetical protein